MPQTSRIACPFHMKISVLINNYNYGRFLADAVDSALAQTFPAYEIVVVDDGSTDDSEEIFRARYSSCANVRFVLQPNSGQLACFITGVRQATGDVVAFLDADDKWKSHYLQRLADIYSQYPQVDFSYCNLEYFGNRHGSRYQWPHDRDLGVSILLGSFVSPWQCSATSGISMRRTLAEKVLQVPEAMIQEYKAHADLFLGYGADIMGGHKYAIAEPLAWYRAHGSNAFLDGEKVAARMYKRMMFRERMLDYYRSAAAVSASHLRLAKLEFKTKGDPSFGDALDYIRMTFQSRLRVTKKVEHMISIIKHWAKAALKRRSRS